MRLETGEVVGGRYTLVAEVGAGGFGTVWRAVDTRGHVVALKFLKPDFAGEDARRFAREAEILSRLSHPNCVGFREFDAGTSGPPWLATEFVEGESLAQWIGPHRTVAEAIGVSLQLAAALAAAHRVGVVHRDLKPSNVMLSSRDGRVHVTVLDFGIGKLLDDRRGDITATGEVIGTPGYMSPEQLRGQPNIGPRSDLYSLGALMFALFAHRPVFGGDSALEVGMQHLVTPAPRLGPAVPEPVRAIVARLLSKDPADRPASAEAVIAALSGPQHVVVRATTPEATSPVLWWAIGLAGLLVVGVLAHGVLSDRDATSEAPAAQKRPPSAILTTTESTTEAHIEPEWLGPMGCRRSGRSGMNERLGAPIYLPHGYDGQKPMPLVILLAEAGQTGAQVMAEMNFRDLADREGFIVAAPNDVRIRTAGLVESFVEDLREHFCFDADRVYLVGHGVGSDVADRLRNPDMFAAIVVTSHRLRHSEMANRIEVETRVPYMMLTPRDDEQAPLAGNDEVVSLADQEGQLRIEHDCEDGPTVTRRKGATCTSWTCATPLVSCAIQGNRHWPDYQHPTKDERGAPSTFAHQVEIWDFLNKFRRVRAPPADCGKSWEPGRADIDGDVVYVPKGYRSDRRHPVIIALPEDNQTPAGLLEELGLDSLADEHQVILYAANSPERGSGEGRSWRIDVTSKTIGRYNQVVARLFESFCIDGTKMFVVGHGASGPFVESLRANRRLAAAATFSHRPTRREHDAFFPREARVPYLYISPLDDPLDPPDGDARVISVEAAEARLMEPFDCDETSPQSHDVEGCRTWTCTTDLVTCRIDGGRHWPGHPEGKASRFPHGKVLMDFFLTHPRASRD